jgi:hypothetical protein
MRLLESSRARELIGAVERQQLSDSSGVKLAFCAERMKRSR